MITEPLARRRPLSQWAALTVALVAGSVGCADSPANIENIEDPPPAVISVVFDDDVGPLLERLTVSLDEPGPVEVDYWTAASPRIRVASDFQSLEWTLGGINSTFEVESNAVFTGQHSVAELASGNVLLFDNGSGRPDGEKYSRALELELDSGSGAARLFWEFRPRPDNYFRGISSARRLENGNTFVAFGLPAGSGGEGVGGPIEVLEVTPEKRVVWHLSVEGETPSMYRARTLSSINGETIVPEPVNQPN